MVVGGSRQETVDPRFVLLGTRQQGVPVILGKLVLPGGFNLLSPSLTTKKQSTHQQHILNSTQVSVLQNIWLDSLNHYELRI
ncbi:unnamed protein product [Schistosoma curassoni]|uniref:Uncharacterized protein n=1 Tax=Schistosoma curassoni TaxID=6186 RepID=A0A183JXL4_9TREM|nr:unnamed protein product [Schistosoma curassoni]